MNSKRILCGLVAITMVVTSCSHAPKRAKESDYISDRTVPKMDASAAREPSSELAGTPWTDWSEKNELSALIVLKGIRDNLLKNNLHDPHIGYFGYSDVTCDDKSKRFRSPDGTCNDLSNVHVGAAGVAFGRNVAPEFVDKEAQKKLMIPNPALVSQEFFTREEFKPVPFLNMLAAVWIQFMNHDWLTHGPNMEKNPYQIKGPDGVVHSVDRTKESTSNRAQYKEGFDKLSANDVTHWWDASQIYGSSQQEQAALRTYSMGKMRTEKVQGRELLPVVNSFDPRNNRQNQGLEATGFRDNWWLGLSMLHTLFVKEHNAIVDQLINKNVTYNKTKNIYVWRNGREVKNLTAKELDDYLFQTARMVNAAVMAKIHTVEWTPGILPNKTLRRAMYGNWYGLGNPQSWFKLNKLMPGVDRTDLLKNIREGYIIGGIVGGKTNNYGVPFSITEEFTSVYRLHSLLPENLELRTLRSPQRVNSVAFPMTRNQFSYDIMAKNDLKDLFYSFGVQNPGQLVLNNFPKFMQELEIPGHGKMDLALVDVLRDRERGVPRYNQFRRGIGLKPIKSYKDFFPPNKPLDSRQMAILEKFYQVYGRDANGRDNVELIDLLVGTSAEEVRPANFGFGETMFQIFILMASRRLMADRFFTEDYNAAHYTQTGLNWVDDEGTLAKVIARHMPELAPKMKGLTTAFQPWAK